MGEEKKCEECSKGLKKPYFNYAGDYFCSEECVYVAHPRAKGKTIHDNFFVSEDE